MDSQEKNSESFIKFLGTAGARFVMISQLRSSGGIWLKYKSTNVIIDPGPGSIVRCNAVRPKLNPANLDAILLTHKHLDHSGDINVMVEAMTRGGIKKRGTLFLPEDALGSEGVVLPYLQNCVEKIIIIRKGNFQIKDINFSIPVANDHSVLTYGLKFKLGNDIVSFSSDTRYFENISEIYKDSSLLVLNTVLYEKKENCKHLCLEDAINIIKKIKPKKTILTHFGMSMLKARPHILGKKISDDLGLVVQCAYDGLTQGIPIETYPLKATKSDE